MKNFLSKVQKIFNQQKKVFIIGVPIALLCLILGIVLLARRGGDTGPHRNQIVLTYAHWNLGQEHDNALEIRMLQAFMDENPHIIVDIDNHIALPWIDYLGAAATDNRLPDVFAIDDLGLAAANNWLMNLTSKAWADVDFFDMPRLVQEAVLINGVVYALPFAQDIHGYFVNRELFAALGHEPPAFGVSADNFINAVRAATDFNHPSISLNHTFSFVEWYPGAINPHFGFFAFDGLGFAINSPEMLTAIQLAADIYRGGFTFYSLSAEAMRSSFPIGYDLGAFRYGQMAMFYGGAGLLDMMVNQVAFDWDFIGVPGGRSVVTLDIVGISANTNHPEEAYLLARWMGHGTEGNLRRLQYAQEMGIVSDMLPVTQNRQVLDALFQIVDVPGLASVYGAMDRALVDGMHVLPGYMQARFSAPTGIAIPGTIHDNAGVNALMRYSIIGNMAFEAHSAHAEYIARQQLEIAQDRLR